MSMSIIESYIHRTYAQPVSYRCSIHDCGLLEYHFSLNIMREAMKARRNAANANSLVGGAGTITWKKLALRIIEHMEMNLHTIG